MTQHDHSEVIEGCYRCELSQDEADAAAFENPFARDQRVVVPAGTRLWRQGEWRTAKRAQTVTVHTVFQGYRDPRYGKAVPPKISWAGSGGYWVDAVVDEAMLEANDL